MIKATFCITTKIKTVLLFVQNYSQGHASGIRQRSGLEIAYGQTRSKNVYSKLNITMIIRDTNVSSSLKRALRASPIHEI